MAIDGVLHFRGGSNLTGGQFAKDYGNAVYINCQNIRGQR